MPKEKYLIVIRDETITKATAKKIKKQLSKLVGDDVAVIILPHASDISVHTLQGE